MKRTIIAAALTLLLTAPVAAQDLKKGAAAYNRGDYATALREWRPLAEKGHAKAQFFLGDMYRRALGVPQDHAEAVKWYRKAAEQGHAKAQNNLGYMYYNGQGVPQNYAEAYIWFSIAAAGGSKDAKERRGHAADRLTPDQRRAAQREVKERWERIRARKK